MTTSGQRVIGAETACRKSSSADGFGPVPAEGIAQVFKALGDPARVRLLSLIANSPGGEACICELTDPLGLSQPTVSHHMKQLTDTGLVTREQRGKWAYFRIAPTARGDLVHAIGRLLPMEP